MFDDFDQLQDEVNRLLTAKSRNRTDARNEARHVTATFRDRHHRQASAAAGELLRRRLDLARLVTKSGGKRLAKSILTRADMGVITLMVLAEFHGINEELAAELLAAISD